MAYHLHYDDNGTKGATHVIREMYNAEVVKRLARILYNHYDRKGDS